MKIIKVNENDTNTLKLRDMLKSYIQCEYQIKQAEKRLKELKDFLKQYDFKEIVLQDNRDTYTLEIKQYERTTKTLDKELLAKELGDLSKYEKETISKNIKFNVKMSRSE